LDHLKKINDRFGHELGNRAILALANHLRANVRGTDFPARYGGDEFAVVLPHQTPAEAALFAERLRHGFRLLRLPPGPGGAAAKEPHLTLSAGVCGFKSLPPEVSPRALVESADRALYQAKRSGRDQVAVDFRAAGHPG